MDPRHTNYLRQNIVFSYLEMIRVSFSLFLCLSVFCYFTLLFIFIKIVLLSLLFYLFIFMKMFFFHVPGCSGMFRNVPCSGFYRRPFWRSSTVWHEIFAGSKFCDFFREAQKLVPANKNYRKHFSHKNLLQSKYSLF